MIIIAGKLMNIDFITYIYIEVEKNPKVLFCK